MQRYEIAACFRESVCVTPEAGGVCVSGEYVLLRLGRVRATDVCTISVCLTEKMHIMQGVMRQLTGGKRKTGNFCEFALFLWRRFVYNIRESAYGGRSGAARFSMEM